MKGASEEEPGQKERYCIEKSKKINKRVCIRPDYAPATMAAALRSRPNEVLHSLDAAALVCLSLSLAVEFLSSFHFALRSALDARANANKRTIASL